MPVYTYRCPSCGHQFEEKHGIHEPAPDCPECEYETPERLITSAPTITGGMATPAGDGRRATKEQLQAKWQEETPKLRKKLRDRLGDDAVNQIPSLNHNYDE